MLALLGFVVLAAVFATYVTIYLVFRASPMKVQALPDGKRGLPTASIVVPTFDEETTIQEKLNDLMRLDYPSEKLEIVVVDSSNDTTPRLVRDYKGRFPVRLTREPERKGEAVALNLGYSVSQGEIVVKSDCDAVCHDDQALMKLVRHFADPHIGGVSCVYTDSYQMQTEAAYRGLLTRLQSAESKMDSTLIAHGAFVGFRKELIAPISPESAADDTEMFVKIRKKGYRCIIDERVVFREIRPPNMRMVRHQRARRAHGIIKVILSNADVLLNPRYGMYGLAVFPSNLFMLVMSPIMLTAGVALAIAGFLFEWGMLGVFAAASFLTVLATSLRCERPRRIVAFIRSQEAALLGLLLFLSVRPKHVWNKAR